MTNAGGEKFHKIMPSYFATNHLSDGFGGDSSFYNAKVEPNLIDEHKVIEELKCVLQQGVEHSLTSDSAILLSGGLDSSLIAVIAKELGVDVATYSMRYNCQMSGVEVKNEDARIAKQLAKSLSMPHQEICISGTEALNTLTDIVSLLDEPYAGGTSMYWMLGQIPEEQVLTGDGADELFMGYPMHEMAYSIQQKGKAENGYALLQKHLNLDDDLLRFLVKQEYLEGKPTIADYVKAHWTDDNGGLLEASLAYFLSDPLSNQVLKFYYYVSQHFQKNVATPFLTDEMVRFALSMPASFKIKEGVTKYPLKLLAKQLLPEYIWRRKKETFVPPVFLWMLGEWKECVLDILSVDNLTKTGILNPSGVYFLLQRFYENPTKQIHAGQILYNLFLFELWWEMDCS